MDKPFDLPGRIACSGPIAAKLEQIRGGGPAVSFDHVTEPAQPLVAAIVARNIEKRVWIVCGNVRAQETFHAELLNWLPTAIFFPEAEVPAAENIMPDPEVAAERMEILQRLAAKHDRQVIVLSRASLEERLPSPGGLKKISIKLARGKKLDRGKLLEQLHAAGYEPAAQVSIRGQYAVRGGIVDIYSWHHTLPVRLEFFDEEIESIRQFDLDSQTSVQHLDQCTLLLGETGSETCALADYFQKEDLLVTVDTELENSPQELRSEPVGSDLRADRRAKTASGIHAAGCPEVSPYRSLTNVKIITGSEAIGEEDYSAAFFDHGLGVFEAGDFVVQESKR
ncbi:MAG TPA: hypothetical protein VG733_09985, partial [Chthoniobacteraceae bacterium]|nr:hypothetical protein [Chthoniobacteraceae bacterium]